jgi:hypothetical protein
VTVIRAGGHVLRGGRWVAEATLPAAGPAPAVEPEPVLEQAAALEVEDVAEPNRGTCPDCGKDVAVNKDGSLRRHNCEV